MWQTTTVNLGKMTPGQSRKARFVWDGDFPDIVNVIASCGCMSTGFSAGLKEVYTTINIATFPKHMKGAGEVNFVKNLVVNYRDGSKEVLYVTGKLIQ